MDNKPACDRVVTNVSGNCSVRKQDSYSYQCGCFYRTVNDWNGLPVNLGNDQQSLLQLHACKLHKSEQG